LLAMQATRSIRITALSFFAGKPCSYKGRCEALWGIRLIRRMRLDECRMRRRQRSHSTNPRVRLK